MATQLNKFDIYTLRENASLAIIGKRAVGKTFLISYIAEILLNDKVNECIVLCLPTDNNTQIYSNLGVTIGEYNKTSVADILNKQKQECKKLLVVFDDCIIENNFYEDKILNELFLYQKQYEITLIFSMQYPINLQNLGFRFDYIILASENIVSVQRLLYNYYANETFSTFEVFNETFCHLTENYNMMIIDNTCADEKIKWIRSENINPDEEFGEEEN